MPVHNASRDRVPSVKVSDSLNRKVLLRHVNNQLMAVRTPTDSEYFRLPEKNSVLHVIM